jgi:hypothetical protein
MKRFNKLWNKKRKTVHERMLILAIASLCKKKEFKKWSGDQILEWLERESRFLSE